MAEGIRVAFYSKTDGGSQLAIRFGDEERKKFKLDRLNPVEKGHRLYFMETENGLKLQDTGILLVCKYAQELRHYEGVYELEYDGRWYYIDHDKVMPLDRYPENKHSYPSNVNRNAGKEGKHIMDVSKIDEPKTEVKSEMNNTEKSTNEEVIIRVLKDKAMDLLLSERTEEAGIIAKAVKILME